MSTSNSPSGSGRPARISTILAGYALAGGLLTLAGWALSIPRLADWDNDGIAQMPNSALGVVLAALGVICSSIGKRRAGRALGGFAAAIAGATLFEIVTGINLGIDTLILHREWGQRGTVAPGRMGLPGSMSLAIAGSSIVLATIHRARRLAATGGLATMGIASLSMIGYLFSADPLYTIPKFTTIALQTSTMMFALGAAVVASIPERAPMRLLLGDSAAALLVRRAMPGVILLPMLLGWLRLRGQEAGLFDTEFGTALLVLTLIGLLIALLWRSARAISIHEAAMRESRDRLAGIVGSITDAFLTCDREWRLFFVNEEAQALLGPPGASLAGRNLWEVMPAATADAAGEHLRRAMNERISVEYDVFVPSSKRWLAHRAYPTSDGGLAIYARDVTEWKRAEKAIRESEHKFSMVFAKAPFGVALARLPSGVFVDVNEAFAGMFGFTRDEAVGRNSLDLGINPDPALRSRIIARIEREGFAHDLETVLHNRAGEERLFLSNITVIEISGKKHLLTTVQDITERKAAEDALRRSTEALLAADRMKDEFLATLSHELRTPLTAIVGWSHILLSADLEKKEQQTALEAIRSSAKAQAQLIEDVLDVSRIVTGKMRLDRQQADLVELIEAAADTVRPAAEAKRIALRQTLDRTVPGLFADRERIQQVIWNLLSNAIKFSPPDTEVEIVLRSDGDASVIEVIDQGCGIPAHFLPHVFERFRQADSSASRAHSGLGIGLALTKNLVELHGGSVSVESEENRGSRFTVRLPLPSLPQSEEGPGREVPASSPAAALDGVRVLYVDDRDDARLLISTMLELHGARVVGASSVVEALEAISREAPHVVLTDLAMPGRDGYDLLATIRTDRRWDHLPVLALTAQARMGDEVLASGAGFHAFLRKPIESDELAAALGRVIDELPPVEDRA